MDKKENIEIIGSGKSITYLIGGTLIGCSSESFKYLFEKNLVENIHSIMILTMDSDHMGGVSSFIDYNRSSDKILNIYAPDGFLSYYNILNISKTTNGTIIDFFISTISHNTVYNITGVKYHFVEMSHINNVQNYGILLNKKKSVFISG